MRFVASLLLYAGVALTVAGCDPITDRRMFSKGIGSDLYTSDVVDVAREQNDYVKAICKQAGFVRDKDGNDCSTGKYVVSDAVWTQFVQAGMNDIDRRCDAYLVWLDNIRRAEAPNLKQLADTHTATQLVLEATSAGVTPMALVAVAFGLAADTLTNINSRLILQVNHSTVQAVVLARQKEYRKDLLGDGKTKPKVVIDNRPAAIYALRNYMRLCMPMTIETEINNTIVAYERGGIEALRAEKMITAMSVSQPVTATQRQFKPVRNFVPLPSDLTQFFDEKLLSKSEGESVLRGLCFDKNKTNDTTTKEALIKELIGSFETYLDDDVRPIKDGKISGREVSMITKQADCGDAKNFQERMGYANTLTATTRANNPDAIKSFADLLGKSKAGGDVPANPTLPSLRPKIKAVRSALNLSDVPSAMDDQITDQLVEALKALP